MQSRSCSDDDNNSNYPSYESNNNTKKEEEPRRRRIIRNHEISFSTRLRFKLNLVFEMEDAKTTKSLPTTTATSPSSSPLSLSSLPEDNIASWFRNYLLVTHSIIRSSVPLMQAARTRCGNSQADKKEARLMSRLAGYYKKHSLEELHHDEWLLDDLESIGVSRQESLSLTPSQAVAELVGSQYYWIHHWHPVCLLGYISFLEGNPPSNESIDQLRESTGYPETAFRTLVKHSDLDPHHRDDLNELLDALPLTEKHKEWITYNALYSANKLLEIRSNNSSRKKHL